MLRGALEYCLSTKGHYSAILNSEISGHIMVSYGESAGSADACSSALWAFSTTHQALEQNLHAKCRIKTIFTSFFQIENCIIIEYSHKCDDDGQDDCDASSKAAYKIPHVV